MYRGHRGQYCARGAMDLCELNRDIMVALGGFGSNNGGGKDSGDCAQRRSTEQCNDQGHGRQSSRGAETWTLAVSPSLLASRSGVEGRSGEDFRLAEHTHTAVGVSSLHDRGFADE